MWERKSRFVISYVIAALAGIFFIICVRKIFWEYMLSVVIFAAVFLIVYFQLKKRQWSSEFLERFGGSFLSGGFFVTGLIWMFTDIYDGSKELTGSYFFRGLGKDVTTILFAIAGVCFCMLYRKIRCKAVNLSIVAGAEIVIFFVSKIWYVRYIAAYDLHYDAYFYPVYRVASGKTLYVDFQGIYGAYPYLIAPFITDTGCRAVEQFSLAMCMLVFLCFTLLFVVFYKICLNKALALTGFFAAMWFSTLFLIRQQGNSFYLQYVPHRMIFPCMMTAAGITYILRRKQGKRGKAVGLFLHLMNVSALFWNLETGLVCVIAVMLLFQLDEILSDTGRQKRMKKIVMHGFFALLDIGGAYLLLHTITYARSGKTASIHAVLFGEQQFADGLLQRSCSLSETQITCWFIVVFVIFITLAKGMVLLLECSRRNKYQGLLQFWLAIVLIGLAAYTIFKSRHPYNTTPVIYFVVLLFVVWLNDYDVRAEYENADSSFHARGGVKQYFGVSVLSLIAASLLLQFPQTDRSCYQGVEVWLPETLGFIEEHLEHPENAELNMINSTYMYCMMNRWDTSELMACADWFGILQVQEMLDAIAHKNKDFVIDAHAISMIRKTGCEELFLEITKKRFQKPIVSENGNLSIYKIAEE